MLTTKIHIFLCSVCLLLFNPIHQVSTAKIINLIPHYCDKELEHKPYLEELNLKASGNDSFIQVRANVFEGIEIVPNYKCLLIVHSPPNTGLVLTVRKATLNNNDIITFKSDSNPERVWRKQFSDNNEDESPFGSEEVFTVVGRDNPSTIIIKYEPTVGVSPLNAGFDLAVTAYKEKQDTCGSDFDCGNNRCVAANLQCDGYNNCGNDYDEDGCSGISWWIVAILVLVAVVVVVLAIAVWIRMSRA